jgi:hypothetical protein
MHVLEVEYPESARVKFGGGYEFATRPRGPDQTVYTLHFEGMRFFFEQVGYPPLGTRTILDLNKYPAINMGLLERFYQEHRLFEPFYYPHPAEGNLVVRFRDPLHYKLKKNGRGEVEPFSVKLILQP